MAKAPVAARSNALSAWTGTELLLWSGNGSVSDVCEQVSGGGLRCGDPTRRDGAAYRPGTNRWRALPKAPLRAEPGSSIDSYASVWTGTELLVWGGPGPEGAAYDPKADTWRTLSPGPLSPRSRFTMTWDGHRAVVAGGIDRRSIGADLGDDAAVGGLARTMAYDPVTDRWTDLPSLRTGRYGHVAAWTKQGIVVLGGSRNRQGDPAGTTELLTPGGQWKEVATSPLLQVDGAVYTGTAVVAYGAQRDESASADDLYPVGAPAFAIYELAADRWRAVPVHPELAASAKTERLAMPAVAWTGREVVVLGAPIGPGEGQGDRHLRGFALEPAGRVLRSFASPLGARQAMTTAWTGDELLVWGGVRSTGFGGPALGNGMRYRPGVGH